MRPEEAVHALYVQRTRKLSLAEIDSQLATLENSSSFSAVFVREAMRAARKGEVQQHWVETLKALSRVGRQYALGDQAFMATLDFLQQDWLLAAIQAATSVADAPLVAVAALARDGSEASYDALVTEFERARAAKSDWALRYKLRRVSRYARKSHHWKELEENVKSELARRDGKMVHGSWAQRLRLNVPLLQFGLTLFGKGKSKARPFIVYVSVQDRSASCQVQSLELADAPQDLVPLPMWLAQQAKKHAITWDWEGARVRSNLRGRQRETMLAWLRGDRVTPAL